MNLFHLAWKSVIDRPLKMLLSAILFALGVGLISFILLMDKQIQENFEKNLAGVDLVIGAKGSPLQMILSAMYHIDAPTGNVTLKEVKPFLNPNHPLIKEALPISMGDSYRGYRIVGTDTSILSWYGAGLESGELWSKNFDVVIGSSVASLLSIDIGHTFKSGHGLVDDENLTHDDAESFKVKGILGPTGTVLDQLILTNTQSYWSIHNHADEHVDEKHSHQNPPKSLMEEDEDNEITSLLLRFKGRNFQALNMQRSINENTDMQAATPAIEINRLFSLMSSAEQALRILAFLIIIVSAVSVFISLYSSLNERKYELALMRSMGAGRSQIFSLITIEGVILAVSGALLGLLLSHGLIYFFADYLSDVYRYNFTAWSFISEELYLFVAAILIGFIAAIIPAYHASKTDIAETLTSG